MTCSASTAFLTLPRTLSTSSQNKNFVSKNRCRVGEIVGASAGIESVSMRCIYHDRHAYYKAGSIYFSILSFKSPTSEFATASGS